MARKITSLTLLIAFALLILTSLVLYVVPEGRVAFWSDWRWLGLSKAQWGSVHTNSGFLFLASGVVHLVFNWKQTVSYLKNRAKQLRILTPGFGVAMAVNVVVVAGTLVGVPPFSTVQGIGQWFKNGAAEKYGEPPYGHAELSSLRLFAKRTGLDLETMKEGLTKAGIQFTDEEQTILTIARANGRTPKAVFDAMQGSDVGVQPLPDVPFPGLGRIMLGDLCRRYGLDEKRVIAALAAKGMKATGQQTLKEIADTHGVDPHAVFDVIHEAVKP